MNVPAGGNLQAALNAAQFGDVILIEAGATFVGPFTLPQKSGAGDYITLRSSAPDSVLPAPNTHVTPAHAGVMPKIISPGNGAPALQTAAGAHHYRLLGLEFKPADRAALVYDLLRLGDGSSAQNTLDKVPHHLEVDRCYIHGWPEAYLKRGIALNSAHTRIVNCYISDCKAKGQDTQAIIGWNGPGPFSIVNNYLEAAGENILFGGSDPPIFNLVPSDIEVRANYLTKPIGWRGVWTVKNLFELKNARRVHIEGNLLEYCWRDGQNGAAILFTVRNQDGDAPWSVVEDVEFVNNIVRHAASGINILGRDNNHPSEQTKRLTIRNNLFDDIDGAKWEGFGALLIISEAANVLVEHNTVFQSQHIATAYGTPTTGFVFRNNITRHNDYGIIGTAKAFGKDTLATYFPGCQLQRNVIAGTPRPDLYPPDNFYPASIDAAIFVKKPSGNYRLAPSSPYKNGGTDGKDIGCDFDALDSAMATSVVTSAIKKAGGIVSLEIQPNPIDDPRFFVRQHYLDFLLREPEQSGLDAWVGVLERCPQNDPRCDRIEVSASFFRSDEFQANGFFIYRFYKVSFGRLPRFNEFIPDLQAIIGQSVAEATAKKDAFVNNWVTRPEFMARYNGLSNDAYVNKLLETAEASLAIRDDLISDLNNGLKTRALVLRAIVESQEVTNQQYNGAFVAMQYFGYLRRDPEPDGYQAWLRVINQNPQDYRTMVGGFVNSIEYRSRFGRP